jgi:Zn-finger nucleic acid-binding protein
MATRPVLGVQHVRTPFLDNLSTAQDRQAETCDRTRGVTTARGTFEKCILMSRYDLDGDVDDDDFDEDEDESDEEDGDGDDDEDDDEEEEVETWQV